MHFFNIAMNLVAGPFVIGYEDDPENFYIKGQTSGNNPKISCRFIDPKGRLLFSMEGNRLSFNQGGKIRMESGADGLTVIDGASTILKIETRNEAGIRVTYIQGYFFDKSGKIAAKGDERSLFISCPMKI